MTRIIGTALAIFAAGLGAGSLVSFLIEGTPRYLESAISGAIIGGLIGLQIYRNDKNKYNSHG